MKKRTPKWFLLLFVLLIILICCCWTVFFGAMNVFLDDEIDIDTFFGYQVEVENTLTAIDSGNNNVFVSPLPVTTGETHGISEC